jgi:hypothetical protein
MLNNISQNISGTKRTRVRGRRPGACTGVRCVHLNYEPMDQIFGLTVRAPALASPQRPPPVITLHTRHVGHDHDQCWHASIYSTHQSSPVKKRRPPVRSEFQKQKACAPKERVVSSSFQRQQARSFRGQAEHLAPSLSNGVTQRWRAGRV